MFCPYRYVGEGGELRESSCAGTLGMLAYLLVSAGLAELTADIYFEGLLKAQKPRRWRARQDFLKTERNSY